MRDEFKEDVKRIAAARVGQQCSNPSCRANTSGPQVDPTKTLSVGVAAHISAASEGGPRYNGALTSEERTHPYNAIWLCQNCAKLVDNDVARYPAAVLKQWKRAAENMALSQIGKSVNAASPGQSDFRAEEIDVLLAAADRGEIVIFNTDQLGKWVVVQSKSFLDQTDPAYAATYLEALESLWRRNLVRHEGGCLFVLTGTGYRVARALQHSMNKEAEEPGP
jgi:hypothetical protein